MRHYVAVLVALSFTGCVQQLHTPDGLTYDLGAGVRPPPDLAEQLDEAWLRDMVALATGQCGNLDIRVRERLHASVVVLVRDGPIDWKGKQYYGLTWEGHISEIALIRSRVPATSHELWHQVLESQGIPDGDPQHTTPCWGLVNGDL